MYETGKSILCYACSVEANSNPIQIHEKIISGYIYHYCCQECSDADFITCSSCQYTEISKKDCANKNYDCCQQYLGGNLQYYCSERCKGEDTTEFIQSFRKK